MNRVVHYLPCSIVCHGECELVLAKQIQSKKRRDLNPLSRDSGGHPIMINTINSFLYSKYPDRKLYIKSNKDRLCLGKDKEIVNHKIFTIMDKDDASDDLFESYKNKDLFKDYWWGQDNLIVPIYFVPNMDTVFSKHGFPIDTKGKKPAQFFKYLTTQYDSVIDMLRNLRPNESNISELLNYLDEIKNNTYKK